MTSRTAPARAIVGVTTVAVAVALVLTSPGVGARGGQDAPTGSTPPPAACREGDTPEPAQQGRVPTAVFDAGWDTPFTCNADLVATHNSTAGFKVLRYLDDAGNECAFYDSTLVFPLDLPTQVAEGAGVVVLDMADPATPVQTTTLTTPAMVSPHESLLLDEERGLLMAVLGTAATFPGQVDIFDVSEDCRDPQLVTSAPVGFLGHESGLSPDGNTFYTSSLFTSTVAAVDISDPALPRTLWVGNHNSHGMAVSDDGTRLYLTPFRTLDDTLGQADGLDGDFDGGLIVLDVTSVQERDPLPQPTVVSTLQWADVSIPQWAEPVTWDGVPHLIDTDEFTDGFDPEKMATGDVGNPGAARIISLADETSPEVIANIRLAVHDPEVRATDGILDDPGADRVAQGYAAHYCKADRRADPRLLACSMIQSGLRVFDIRDPADVREIAYVNVPGRPGTPPINPQGAAYAMARPAFALERNEIWFADRGSGFHVVRLAEEVFPFDTEAAPVSTPTTDPGSTAPAPSASPPTSSAQAPAAPVPAAAPSPAAAAPSGGSSLPATGGAAAVAGVLALLGGLALRRR